MQSKIQKFEKLLKNTQTFLGLLDQGKIQVENRWAIDDLLTQIDTFIKLYKETIQNNQNMTRESVKELQDNALTQLEACTTKLKEIFTTIYPLDHRQKLPETFHNLQINNTELTVNLHEQSTKFNDALTSYQNKAPDHILQNTQIKTFVSSIKHIQGPEKVAYNITTKDITKEKLLSFTAQAIKKVNRRQEHKNQVLG
jgi:hypothetical protein